MDNVDKFFRESHYNIIRVLLSVSGLWPYHTTGKRCAIYFVFLLVLGSGMTFEVHDHLIITTQYIHFFNSAILLFEDVVKIL